MTTINVQFEDSTEAMIVAYLDRAQDPSVYSNQGTVTTGDPIWKTYYDSFPPNMQEGLPAPTAS